MTDQLRQAAQQALEALIDAANVLSAPMFPDAVAALSKALAQEHALHELARLGQEIEQAEPVSTNAAMRDARLNAGWGSEQQAEPVAFYDFTKGFRWAKPTKVVAPTIVDVPPMALYAAPQQQAEPVAWRFKDPKDGHWLYTTHLVDLSKKYWRLKNELFDPLYTTPPQQQAVFDCPRCGHVCSQRLWVDLTDEDWEKVENRKNTVLDTFEQGATWAAYKLQNRNT